MSKKIKSFKEVCKVCEGLKRKGKKVVFVHGFFDILHRGHVTLLVEAKKLGDILVVGVDHDDNARTLKGPKRPVQGHDSRIFVLSRLEPVDYVFLIPSLEKLRKPQAIHAFYDDFYLELKPDIVATCMKAGKHGHLKRKHARAVGAEFIDIRQAFYDKSTTKIIELLGLD